MSDTMASIKESEGILHSKMATPQKAQKSVKYDTNIMRQLNEADAREEKEMQESIREAKLEVAQQEKEREEAKKQAQAAQELAEKKAKQLIPEDKEVAEAKNFAKEMYNLRIEGY